METRWVWCLGADPVETLRVGPAMGAQRPIANVIRWAGKRARTALPGMNARWRSAGVVVQERTSTSKVVQLCGLPLFSLLIRHARHILGHQWYWHKCTGCQLLGVWKLPNHTSMSSSSSAVQAPVVDALSDDGSI